MKLKFCLLLVTGVLLTGSELAQVRKPNTAASVLVKGPLGIITRCVVNGDDIYWLEENSQNILYTRTTGGYPAPLVRTNIKIELFILSTQPAFIT
ncbi:MAG: hypothetical protein AABM67_10480 [Acidobacteriota bacterium]